ncbi:MAG: site-specific DNA-methyltransferase, partial [Chloroherpetonaceae bacterium]
RRGIPLTKLSQQLNPFPLIQLPYPHVAPFPKELPRRLIKAFSYVTETVLDPFLGSGTSCVVAAELGRNGIGYELNPEIAEDAVREIGETPLTIFSTLNGKP